MAVNHAVEVNQPMPMEQITDFILDPDKPELVVKIAAPLMNSLSHYQRFTQRIQRFLYILGGGNA